MKVQWECPAYSSDGIKNLLGDKYAIRFMGGNVSYTDFMQLNSLYRKAH